MGLDLKTGVDIRLQLNQALDQCVKCGICLPHCPTYRIWGVENESPRGRIALLQGLLSGEFSDPQGAHEALNHCLMCQACERVCPSRVQYGQLYHQGQQLFHFSRPQQRWQGRLNDRLFKQVINRPQLLLGLAKIIRLAQRCGLMAWLSRQTWLMPRQLGTTQSGATLPASRWLDIIPPLDPHTISYGWHRSACAPSLHQGEVGLFLGCVARIFDQPVFSASIQLLNQLGFDVFVPQEQGCCGALQYHQGNSPSAEKSAVINLKSFAAEGITTVVVSATGCNAVLKQYSQWDNLPQPWLEKAQSLQFVDIGHFLQQHWRATVALKPQPLRVALHQPCTLVNALQQSASTVALLQRIPTISLLSPPPPTYCCGAAGTQMLRNPHQAQALADRWLDAVLPHNPTCIVTSNIGCRLHFQAVLKRRGVHLPVKHSVELLLQSLPANNPVELKP